LSAQGRLFESLNIYGGVTFNDSKVRVDANRNVVGKEVPDAPRFTGKLYVEYDLPFLDGMTITGSINHYGKVFTNTYNNLSIPGRTIGDLGFRYAANILGQDMAWRFNVQNITNKAYWYGGTGSHLVIGQPRSFSLIGELNF
jgi:iron complex outermembrane receptor protein